MRKLGILASLLLVALALSVALGPQGSTASSHREAPMISQDPSADTTDVYMFRSPDNPDTVTIITTWWPFEEPMGGPNYFRFGDDVLYEIHIDNNGDAQQDITYQFTFRTQIQNGNTFLYNTGELSTINDSDYNLRQYYRVNRLSYFRVGGRRYASPTQLTPSELLMPPVNIGPRSTPNYEALSNAGIYTLSGGIKVFAGQVDDPFFVDLGVFDLLALRSGNDTLKGYNSHAIAIQVPISQLRGSDPVVGTWATASRASLSIFRKEGETEVAPDAEVDGADPQFHSFYSPFRQVSRLGMPLVNEVVVPLRAKDAWNASHPSNDSQFAGPVLDPELPKLLTLLYPGLFPTVPATPRNDLVTVFLTGIPGLNKPSAVRPSEMLRLNVEIDATPLGPDGAFGNRMGVVGGDLGGFPNGRRLSDDVTDIALQVAAGLLLGGPLFPDTTAVPNAGALGDGVNANDKPFRATFPYLALPHQGYNHTHHP